MYTLLAGTMHMLRSFQKYTLLVALALLSSFVSIANRVQAQTYQIDCAILLCLSGGWPGSVPCTRARAEFIRRITPWPIEPPLRIWRCPMGTSSQSIPPMDDAGRIYDVLFATRDRPRPNLAPAAEPLRLEHTGLSLTGPKGVPRLGGFAPQLAQGRAEISISGPEFNFVRSIRVFDVLIDDDRDDGGCDRYARVRVGNYDPYGSFGWQGSNRGSIPAAFGPTRHGCFLYARAVFVEWRDYRGIYGSERINY